MLQQFPPMGVCEAEYTPNDDMLEVLHQKVNIIPSNPANSFRPGANDYDIDATDIDKLSADEFNERLFSFSPPGPESYDNDMEILAKCV